MSISMVGRRGAQLVRQAKKLGGRLKDPLATDKMPLDVPPPRTPNARERYCRVRGARVLICLPPAASQRTMGPSGGRSRTRSVELQRDTKTSRFLVARNRKFES